MSNGTNKINRGLFNPQYDLQSNTNFVKLAEVISIDDQNDLGRIKARIKGSSNMGGDDDLSNDDLPWSFPILPKHFYIKPKIGEAVFILVFSKEKQNQDRLYFGPIISQPQKLDKDPFYFSALRGFTFSSEYPDVSADTIPELKGVFPGPEDISIQGRYNTDITQKRNEIVIRAGKFVENTPNSTNPFYIKFNNKTQGYIQIKNDAVIKKQTKDNKEERGTVTNIVSNKINLLTLKDTSPIFNLNNNENLISDDELERILSEAHQLPFGDILLEYLKLLKNAILSHVHNGNGNPPTNLAASGNKSNIDVLKTKAEDLEKKMLSQNVRIN